MDGKDAVVVQDICQCSYTGCCNKSIWVTDLQLLDLNWTDLNPDFRVSHTVLWYLKRHQIL